MSKIYSWRLLRITVGYWQFTKLDFAFDVLLRRHLGDLLVVGRQPGDRCPDNVPTTKVTYFKVDRSGIKEKHMSLIIFVTVGLILGGAINGGGGAIAGRVWGIILWWAINAVRRKKKGRDLNFRDKWSLGMADDLISQILAALVIPFCMAVGLIVIGVPTFLLTGIDSPIGPILGMIAGALVGFKAFAYFKERHIDKHL